MLDGKSAGFQGLCFKLLYWKGNPQQSADFTDGRLDLIVSSTLHS